MSEQFYHPYFDGCKCYVRYLTEEVVFSLHFGAHNPTCPAYRASLDPVDRRADDDFRARVEVPDEPNMSCLICGAAKKDASRFCFDASGEVTQSIAPHAWAENTTSTGFNHRHDKAGRCLSL